MKSELSELESKNDKARRIRHAGRVAYAAACVLATCGYRVKVEQAPKQRAGRCWIYAVDGVPGTLTGQETLRGWLWDHGIKIAPASFSRAMTLNKGVGKFGPYTVRQVGLGEKAGAVAPNPKHGATTSSM